MYNLLLYAQVPYPPINIDGSQPWTNGAINISNVENIIYYNSATLNSIADLKAAHEILFQPDALTGEYSATGSFHASIQPEVLSIVSFHPNGWVGIPRYEKFEMGIKLPSSIQTQIDAFMNGQPGINPYDPDQIKVECNYNNGAYKRYGFYYRDFSSQNNQWIENTTEYTFRIRLAPEQVGSNIAVINIYINGALTETVTRYFDVQTNNNPGHLHVSNDGNLLKLQYDNGDMFFGVGQNIGYAIPITQPECAAGDCISPLVFQNQRDYITDLGNNGGNFIRLRMDALNMLCEWPYTRALATDPISDPNKPLSSYLNNYNDNQRYLWEFDKTFATMESSKVRSVLCLLPDQNFSPDGGYDPNHSYTWNHNPYNTITGNNITGCKAFFSNPQSISTYRKWLYYVMARYGYSTSLAMWEMINETVNVANVANAPHLIDRDAAFNTDVKNWVCDMKYYLQQQYPIHPATTGFVSDTNRRNIAYDCLNVWSSNSYVGYIDSANGGKYIDDDYEERANTLLGANNSNIAGYFPNYKPFFWGEMGIGDAANIIDKKSDRPFHNTIWASTFTGGISNGLYWNDWEQAAGVSHRNNFKALRAFVDMIDFTQRLEPFKSKDFGANSLNNREIHTWYMKNGAKNYIVGWTKNNSANWTQDLGNFSSTEQSLILAKTNFNNNPIEYTCFSTNQNPETTIDGLLSVTNYKIKIYDTYDNANEIEVKNVTSSINGTLKFKRDMYSFINDPFNPDYAFIIKPNSSWRFANNTMIISDTIYITTLDTVMLSSNFAKNNVRYTFNWDITDEHYKHDSAVFINYPYEGTYNLNLEAKNTQNDTLVNHHFIIKVSDNTIKKDLEKIVVYPNPANNYVYIYYNNETIKNPKITCNDMLGNEQEFYQTELFKFNTSNLVNGLYIIKFQYSNHEQVFKVNIIH